MSDAKRDCGSRRYGRGSHCTEAAKWDVVYRNRDRSVELDRHPACFTHGMAEVDRHVQSGGIAHVDIEKPPGGPGE